MATASARSSSHITWVLVGDDGENYPTIYADIAQAHPGRVAAIAFRQVGAAPSSHTTEITASVLRSADGDALLPQLRDALGQSPTGTKHP